MRKNATQRRKKKLNIHTLLENFTFYYLAGKEKKKQKKNEENKIQIHIKIKK